MSFDTIPKDLRGLRACLVCALVKVSEAFQFVQVFTVKMKTSKIFQSFDQFEVDGCDNCEEFLRLKNNKDQVYDCTSNNFDGLIAVMSPEDSWVCKWQRISKYNFFYSKMYEIIVRNWICDVQKLIFTFVSLFFCNFRSFYARHICNFGFGSTSEDNCS